MRDLLWGAGALLLLAAAPAMAQDADLHFSESTNGLGVCRAEVWGDVVAGSKRHMELSFVYSVREGELSVQMIAGHWPEEHEIHPAVNVPVTLGFDTGTSPRSSVASYQNRDAENESGISAYWEAGASAAAVMELLKTARSVHVRFDGMDYAFRLPAAGRVHDSLTTCAARVRAGTP